MWPWESALPNIGYDIRKKGNSMHKRCTNFKVRDGKKISSKVYWDFVASKSMIHYQADLSWSLQYLGVLDN